MNTCELTFETVALATALRARDHGRPRPRCGGVRAAGAVAAVPGGVLGTGPVRGGGAVRVRGGVRGGGLWDG